MCISAGSQSHAVVNGLDFYPTILSMNGSKKLSEKPLDGSDLLPLLTKNEPVKQADGKARDTMVWHFLHGVALESTIRNYDHVKNAEADELELYRLYDGTQRVDIEESKSDPEVKLRGCRGDSRGNDSLLSKLD